MELLIHHVFPCMQGKYDHLNAKPKFFFCIYRELPVIPPPCDSPPVSWWDNEADKCLLLGVYKHGYERFNVMRMDPCLSFLARCGPPDGAAVLAEMANGQVILFQPPLCP